MKWEPIEREKYILSMNPREVALVETYLLWNVLINNVESVVLVARGTSIRERGSLKIEVNVRINSISIHKFNY